MKDQSSLDEEILLCHLPFKVLFPLEDLFVRLWFQSVGSEDVGSGSDDPSLFPFPIFPYLPLAPRVGFVLGVWL